MAPSETMVTVNDPAHDYNLRNVGEGSQNIKFIKKEPVEEGSAELKLVHDGTTTEAVLQMVQARLEALYERLPDEFTKAAIDHLTMALSRLNDRNADRDARGVRGSNQA